MISWAGLTAPSGFFLCNGAAVSRTAFATLFNAIGTFYGSGDGSTTFNIPDLRGRVAAMIDTTGSRLTSFSMSPNGSSLGAVGGTEGVGLVVQQLPSHFHANTLSDPGHNHLYNQAVGGGNAPLGSNLQTFLTNVGANTGNSSTGISLSNVNAGGNDNHLNVQPTLLLNAIIKF